MRLTDLDPHFVRIKEEPREVDTATMPTGTDAELDAWVAAGSPCERQTALREVHEHVSTLAEADGIYFTCPLCQNHMVAPTFAGRNVPDHLGSQNRDKQPSRWQASGTGFDDLTLNPSIDLSGTHGGCQWHGWVKNGEAA